jgi:hypothetical protein
MTDIKDATTRQELIKEVFIDPIRTVVVIDDEFPTIDALIGKELKATTSPPWKEEDLTRVKQILDFARQKDRPWLVDVHDAKQIKIDAETRIAPYLDHSDLVVLDYHLAGDSGSGDASIQILRQLARNGHHNLVVLYTKGYDGDMSRVLREIALGLSCPDAELEAQAANFTKIEEEIYNWEAEEPGIADALIKEISEDIFLNSRKQLPINYQSFLATPESATLKDKARTRRMNLSDLVKWLFLQRQIQWRRQMWSENIGPIQRSTGGSQYWLKCDRLFLTIVPKKESPSQFEAKLTAALIDSFPTPHRILISQIRAAIDQQGSRAEIAVLGERSVQTAWLDDFLSKDPPDESTAVMSAVNRHWEALGDRLQDNLIPFSKRLRSAFLEEETSELFKQCGLNHTDLKLDDTVLEYNRFISTKRFDRSHLTTGHAFRLKSEGSKEEFWICLSPACDMVPGQKTSGWNSRLGNSLPFTAFRLFEVTSKNAADDATSNNYVFFNLDGSPKAFSIYPQEGNIRHNPEWEQMFVQNHGRFEADSTINILKTGDKDGALQQTQHIATVFAQLRAEYALNLLQRVSAFLFRPGLGMHFRKRH